MRYLQRAGRVLAALLCAVVLLTAELAPAAAVSQAEIDALKSNASDLNKQKKDLKNKLSALSDDISNTMEKKELLDQQISNSEKLKEEEKSIGISDLYEKIVYLTEKGLYGSYIMENYSKGMDNQKRKGIFLI